MSFLRADNLIQLLMKKKILKVTNSEKRVNLEEIIEKAKTKQQQSQNHENGSNISNTINSNGKREIKTKFWNPKKKLKPNVDTNQFYKTDLLVNKENCQDNKFFELFANPGTLGYPIEKFNLMFREDTISGINIWIEFTPKNHGYIGKNVWIDVLLNGIPITNPKIMLHKIGRTPINIYNDKSPERYGEMKTICIRYFYSTITGTKEKMYDLNDEILGGDYTNYEIKKDVKDELVNNQPEIDECMKELVNVHDIDSFPFKIYEITAVSKIDFSGGNLEMLSDAMCISRKDINPTQYQLFDDNIVIISDDDEEEEEEKEVPLIDVKNEYEYEFEVWNKSKVRDRLNMKFSFESIDFGKIFFENGIEGKDLVKNITRTKLHSMGIKSLGYKIKVLNWIKELKNDMKIISKYK